MIEKLTAAYRRMSERERKMTLVIAGILFVLINLFVWRLLLGTISNSRRELATRKSTRAEQVVYMREREIWEKQKTSRKAHQAISVPDDERVEDAGLELDPILKEA